MSLFLAAIYDRFMQASEDAGLGAWRRELLASAAGDVLEIGAGTGANLAFYSPKVRRLVMSEPDAAMRKRLARRVRAGTRVAEIVSATSERLPFPGASFDAVVATLVLCSVDDPRVALDEVRRVLRPGGRFLFIEHVESDRTERQRWQRRLEPIWKRIADNCHLTRRTDELIVAAGFRLEHVERASMRKAMPIVRPTVRGVARAPGGA